MCVCVYLKGRAHGAKRLSGAHVLMASRACVEMKINERETREIVCVYEIEGSVECPS